MPHIRRWDLLSVDAKSRQGNTDAHVESDVHGQLHGYLCVLLASGELLGTFRVENLENEVGALTHYMSTHVHITHAHLPSYVRNTTLSTILR